MALLVSQEKEEGLRPLSTLGIFKHITGVTRGISDTQVFRYGNYRGGENSVFNGIRRYQVEITKDIPSSLRLGGRNCWVRYRGQPRTCLKCGVNGHEAKNCDQIKCYNCHEFGHAAKDCTTEVKCTVYEKSGHTSRTCPISFANKISPTARALVKGPAVLQQEAETAEKSDEITAKGSDGDTNADVTESMSSASRYWATPQAEPLDTNVNMDDDHGMTQDPQNTEESLPITESQTNLFENAEVIESMSSASSNWATPKLNPSKNPTVEE
ncbi:putative zinc finger CCHC domain-containing protein 3-like [Apostichopus japonicus]|uniref:Putative zinc finger CCHC domain-containing protein 3-like n=1 Tax=Stichopus japonicus TaxID=307972 RepID=A0A2G8KVD2_STIJA|nr:putative zinc finger CCHC domain-containing protein 3-like [Apostichopus japonicus]